MKRLLTVAAVAAILLSVEFVTAQEDKDITNDTGKEFTPEVPTRIDPDTGNWHREKKKLRVVRRQNGKKEVYYSEPPPTPTKYPLDPVKSATGEAKPNVKVSGYVHTVDKDKQDPPSPIFGTQEFYGNMILFCVDGCPDATFYQFYKQTISYSFKADIEKHKDDKNPEWKFDTLDGKVGPYKKLPETISTGNTQPGMYDAPGIWGRPAADGSRKAGSTETITQEFETFVCCDHQLIGYWTWEQVMTYTWQNDSSWSAPSVTPAAPKWNPDAKKGGDPYELIRKNKICAAP